MSAHRMHRTRLVVVAAALLLPLAVAVLPPTGLPGFTGASAGPQLSLEDPPTTGDGPVVPDLVPRSAWDPKGTCPPGGGQPTTPRRIQLHHTHVPVVDRPAEVPEALRSVCRTHRNRGFSDIGYHYAIDPSGTVWQGRGPRLTELGDAVRQGAHAQGFNAQSLGVVLIGDFDAAPPTPEARRALVELLALLSTHFQLDPTSQVATVSTGGPVTRFAEGVEVELPAIAGHRDTGSGTACPGEHLYALLPEIRSEVAALVPPG